MNRKSVSIIVNLAKVVIISFLFFAIYSEYIELEKIKEKNSKVIKTIELKNRNLEILKQIVGLYQNEDYIYPYLVREYGLLKRDNYKLYIMEVEN
ncbi:MAG: hypothetical protein NZM44_05295 [Candidatus Calescibacterium sp.]|nr:hypothetical protein [Candidatus Calescibacterium sp.]MCS7243886.1 hypothetical protein [Candidatus Calescibacterium sp.]MDW8132805.1 hypothetical protein [Candidatus Calescibacterium sp.]